MKEFKYVIKDEQGIHARPAGMFVKEAAAFSSKVTISKDGKGDDEDAAIEKLSAFLQENL